MQGIYVTGIHDGTPAAKSGLCVHDKLLQVLYIWSALTERIANNLLIMEDKQTERRFNINEKRARERNIIVPTDANRILSTPK